MTNRSRLAGGCAVAIVLALLSAGCGRSSSVLTPDTGVAGSNDTVELAPGEAVEAGAREGNDEMSHDATPISGRTTITEPGDYRLIDDIKISEGDAIVIRASNVRLWLGKHRLHGPGNKSGRALVIDGAQDVLVRGGRIENFGFGAVLMNASRCRVRDLTIQGGDETADPANGNPPQIGIMLVNSAKNAIRENRMRGVNLGIFVRGGGSYENVINGNAVVGGNHGLLAICYNPAPGGDPAGPMRDRVKSNYLARFGTGIVTSEHSSQNVFAMNTIRYFDAAYVDNNGTNVFVHNRTIQIEP